MTTPTKESRVLTALQEGRTHTAQMRAFMEQVTQAVIHQDPKVIHHQILLLTQKAEAETFNLGTAQEQLLLRL